MSATSSSRSSGTVRRDAGLSGLTRAQTPRENPAELDAEQIRAGAHLRLVPVDAVRSLGDGTVEKYTYARQIGGGMLELLVQADGPSVRWLTDADVARVGYPELHALGRERLLAVRSDVSEVLRGRRSELHTIRGRSAFLASKVLVLEHVMRTELGRKVTWPHGVLVSMPSRHELVFTPVDENVVANLAALLEVTATEHREEIAPFSELVFWWQDGTLTALSELDEFGEVRVLLPEEFRDVVMPLLADDHVA